MVINGALLRIDRERAGYTRSALLDKGTLEGSSFSMKVLINAERGNCIEEDFIQICNAINHPIQRYTISHKSKALSEENSVFLRSSRLDLTGVWTAYAIDPSKDDLPCISDEKLHVRHIGNQIFGTFEHSNGKSSTYFERRSVHHLFGVVRSDVIVGSYFVEVDGEQSKIGSFRLVINQPYGFVEGASYADLTENGPIVCQIIWVK